MEGLLYFVGFYALIALAIFLYKYLSDGYELIKYNNKFKKIYRDVEAFDFESLKQKKENIILDFQEQKKSLNEKFKFSYDLKEKNIVEDLIKGDQQWRQLTAKKKATRNIGDINVYAYSKT